MHAELRLVNPTNPDNYETEKHIDTLRRRAAADRLRKGPPQRQPGGPARLHRQQRGADRHLLRRRGDARLRHLRLQQRLLRTAVGGEGRPRSRCRRDLQRRERLLLHAARRGVLPDRQGHRFDLGRRPARNPHRPPRLQGDHGAALHERLRPSAAAHGHGNRGQREAEHHPDQSPDAGDRGAGRERRCRGKRLERHRRQYARIHGLHRVQQQVGFRDGIRTRRCSARGL